MEIRIRNTGEVMTEITFRDTFRDRVLPAQLTAEWLEGFAGGCDVVLEGPQATTQAPYEFSFRNGVEQIDGKWYTKYSVGPVFVSDSDGTAEEKMAAYRAQKDAEQSKNVRQTRNEKLKECDWTQLADSTADKQAWATYRQALRDVPTQTGFPWNVVWPDQP